MKTRNCLLIILLAGVFALVGCGKPPKNPAQDVPGMMDLPKFQQAFASGTPDQRGSVDSVCKSVRYGLFPDALAALDKLAGDSTLTEPQKQAVNNLIQGIKQKLANPPAAPPR
jgi:hypothetical protein